MKFTFAAVAVLAAALQACAQSLSVYAYQQRYRSPMLTHRHPTAGFLRATAVTDVLKDPERPSP